MRSDGYRDDEAARRAMMLARHAEAAERAVLLDALLGSLPPVDGLPGELRALRARLRAPSPGDDADAECSHLDDLETALRDADAVLAHRRALEEWGKRVRNLRTEVSLGEARLREGDSAPRGGFGATPGPRAAVWLASIVMFTTMAREHAHTGTVGLALGGIASVYGVFVALDPRRRKARRENAAALAALAETKALLAREVARRDLL